MNDRFAEDNYYDKDGKLLLAKGQKITDSIQNALIKLNAVNTSFSENEIDVDEVIKKLNLGNRILFDYPVDILNRILFESKDKPWYILINALSNYIDWLYSHCINVTLISLIMAIDLGFTADMLNDLCMGALFHDVGMLAIPKNILLKTDELVDIERSIIKQHCEIGHSVVVQYGFSKMSNDIVLQHHEHLDGSGYPSGISDGDIDDGAKIVMIADVIDSITSYRPYRAAMRLEDAFDYLKNNERQYSKDYISVLSRLLQISGD